MKLEEAPRAVPSHDDYEARLRARSVLYVDDEEVNREMFELTLGADLEVVTAASAEAALELLARRRVSIIVSDHRMPGTTGVELLARTAKLYPDIPRILVTAYSDRETAIDAINRAGVVGYIAKPWRIEEVRLVLDQAIGNAQLRQALGWLHEETRRREHESALATTRGEVLHDLANVHLALEGVRFGLENLLDEARPSLAAEQARQFGEELELFREATEHLSRLHARTRSKVTEPLASAEPSESTALARLFATTIELVRAGHPTRVQFEVRCPPGLTVRADRLDLSRVLVNLVTNAVQAIEESGRGHGAVHLEATRDGDRACIHVRDDGPGIPAALRSRIFEAGVTGRRERGGTGLGLAICVQLTRAHGGRLELEPPSPHGGTSFRIELLAGEDLPAGSTASKDSPP